MARGVLDYLLRSLTHPEGGLYAAEDADSLDPVSGEKKEGWCYAWSWQEVQELLGEQVGGRKGRGLWGGEGWGHRWVDIAAHAVCTTTSVPLRLLQGCQLPGLTIYLRRRSPPTALLSAAAT